ncbi:MAG: hypothetical protein CSB21_02160 [Deltaproteobacteria bacterium]|nr:MAG: hypothetical protein CSB21_02160 [Deltaproteobacteria bacterium]
MKPENKNILKVLELSKEMLLLADNGDKYRKDTGCGIVYGVLRDYSYKLRALAEEEILIHYKKGSWDGDDSVIEKILN